MSLERIILSGLLILCLCACDGNTYSGISENGIALSSPNLSPEMDHELEDSVNAVMTALKSLDMDQFNANTNNKQIMVTPWGDETTEYTLFGELCGEQDTDSDQELVYQLDQEIVQHLSWEILSARLNNDTAKIKLRITNLNMEGILERAQSNSEMISEIRKIPPNHTKSVDFILEAQKKNEKWELLVDVDFANAVSANIWTVDPSDAQNGHSPCDRTDCDLLFSESIERFAAERMEEDFYTYEGVAKASQEQKIEIISADGQTVAQITDLQEITEFLNQEEMHHWAIVEELPDQSRHLLTIIRFALERKTISPQLKEQSRHLFYEAQDRYYIEDLTTYPFPDPPDYESPRYYRIPNPVGEYLKQFLQKR